ncbi:MAG: zinc ribbon domain-containing protein [Eubacterium sp.]|nr:zinc ribbon domain-containing protein [Eubacterium sp.]
MFCKNCGSELKDGAKFCTNCGAKLENHTVIVNETNQIDINDSHKENFEINNKNTKSGKRIIKILIPIICIPLLIVLIITTYNYIQAEKYRAGIDSFNRNFTYEGLYLLSGAELSENQKYLENITFSPNNLDEFNSISKSELLGSFSVYEAQVLWDSNHGYFYLKQGYDVGNAHLTFSYARGVVNKSVDTGKITIDIETNDYWNGFKENKVYNFHCEAYEREFDSFFRYINGKFIPVTFEDMNYIDINTIWIDDKMYLGASDGTDYWYDGDVIDIRNEW